MKKKLRDMSGTLAFDKFWAWLGQHANCITRCGTPEVVLLDQDDCHWTLQNEDEHTHTVQLCRAKDIVAELMVFSSEIAYVQSESEADGDGEYLFDCVAETEKGRVVVYHFALSHEYEEAQLTREDKWTH